MVAISSMNASMTKPWNEAPTDRQKPNGMPGSFSVYSTADFGMCTAGWPTPSTEMKSTPFGGSAADALHQRLLHDALHEGRGFAGRIDRAPHARVLTGR